MGKAEYAREAISDYIHNFVAAAKAGLQEGAFACDIIGPGGTEA
jgi:hypothetical protein